MWILRACFENLKLVSTRYSNFGYLKIFVLVARRVFICSIRVDIQLFNFDIHARIISRRYLPLAILVALVKLRPVVWIQITVVAAYFSAAAAVIASVVCFESFAYYIVSVRREA